MIRRLSVSIVPFFFVGHDGIFGALQYISSQGGALSAIASILLILSAYNTLAGQLRQPHAPWQGCRRWRTWT